MIIGGSILTFIGTAVTIYGNNLNNNIDAAEAFEHFWNTSTISYNPGDPFFIAGLVVLGVGALLLVGGVVWLIIAKNKSE